MPRHQLAEPVVAPANVHADIVKACMRTEGTSSFLRAVGKGHRRQRSLLQRFQLGAQGGKPFLAFGSQGGAVVRPVGAAR